MEFCESEFFSLGELLDREVEELAGGGCLGCELGGVDAAGGVWVGVDEAGVDEVCSPDNGARRNFGGPLTSSGAL